MLPNSPAGRRPGVGPDGGDGLGDEPFILQMIMEHCLSHVPAMGLASKNRTNKI